MMEGVVPYWSLMRKREENLHLDISSTWQREREREGVRERFFCRDGGIVIEGQREERVERAVHRERRTLIGIEARMKGMDGK